MLKDRTLRLEELLVEVKTLYLQHGDKGLIHDGGWCAYTKDTELFLATECYISDFPMVDMDTDQEIFRALVTENNLDTVYSCELLQDVVMSAFEQKSDITNAQLREAIRYYLKNDDFMDF